MRSLLIAPQRPNILVLVLILGLVAVGLWKFRFLYSTGRFFDETKLERFLNSTLDWNGDFGGFCSLSGESCVPPFRPLNEAFVRKIVAVPKYRLAACILPKCMSTVTTRIYSFLFDNQTFTEFNWLNDNGKSASHHKNDFDSFRTFKHNLRLSDMDLRDWSLNVAIRDPLDRVVSAFVDKWNALYGGGELCYGCGENFDCFLREQFKRTINYANGATKHLSYEDQHVVPQNWFCDFGDHLEQYNILKHTTDFEGKYRFRETMQSLLESRNVTAEEIKYVTEVLIGGASKSLYPSKEQNSTAAVTAQRGTLLFSRQMAEYFKDRLLRSTELYRIFIAMYYNDYTVFKYDFPNMRI